MNTISYIGTSVHTAMDGSTRNENLLFHNRYRGAVPGKRGTATGARAKEMVCDLYGAIGVKAESIPSPCSI